jgi:Xaa-Pro aminopeptidase
MAKIAPPPRKTIRASKAKRLSGPARTTPGKGVVSRSAAKPGLQTPGGQAAKPARLPAPANLSVPMKVYTGRLAAAANRVEAAGVTHALISNPLDVAYLTGFLGGDSYLLLAADSGAPVTLISDSRYEEELGAFKKLVTIVIRKGPMNDAAAGLTKAQGVARLGLQSEHVTLSLRDALAKLLDGSGTSLVTTPGLIAPLREIKDAYEVALIRRAVEIQQQALLSTLPHVTRAMKKRERLTEADVAARLEMEMKLRGSSAPGFESIIAAQANGSLPHYRPSVKVELRSGTPLLIDWGAIYAGYHSDMTRTFSLGKWSPQMREIYEVVRAAYLAGAKVAGPDATTRDVDAAARNVIVQAGFGEKFGHGTGHGIGFNGHEAPSVSHMAPAVQLRPGMIITIEPGIYLPGVGGVRIEDDFLITKDGCENLCSLPTDIAWATL